MASQYGTTRIYSSVDEKDDPKLKQCDVCNVKAVPRGITSTRKNEHNSTDVHCPNCGQVYGRENH